MRTITAVVTAVALLALGSAASALTVELEWSGSGTSITGTDFVGSEVVTLEVYAMPTVPPGLDGVVVSISWDSDALSLVSCTPANTTVAQYVAGGSFEPVHDPCPSSSPGLQPALGQAAISHPYLAGPGRLDIASLQFHVTGSVKGNTIVQSFFNPVADGWMDNSHVFHQDAILGTATVHVPEPTTAILMGVGCLALIGAGRRGRRG